jgi:hypothetical protein
VVREQLKGSTVMAEREDDELAEWWREEARRHNELGEMARAKGYLVGTPNRQPPPLNPDGSLATGTENVLLSGTDVVGNDADPRGFDHWITVKGQHILVRGDQTPSEAIKDHFHKLKEKGVDWRKAAKGKDKVGGGKAKEHGGEHGGHHHPAHLFEHGGHFAHTAHEAHEVAEALGGSHEAHAAVAHVHELAHHAAEAHGGSHDLAHAAHAHPGGLDASAIIARHAFGPAVKAVSAALKSGICGGPCIKAGNAISAVHKGVKDFVKNKIDGMEKSLGTGTTMAVLGAGAITSHHVMGMVGLHGPLASIVPYPHLVGAIPALAVLGGLNLLQSQYNKRSGRKDTPLEVNLVGEHSKIEKGLSYLGTWVEAIGRGMGTGYMKGMGAAGKVAGAAGRQVKEMRQRANNRATDAVGNTDDDRVTLPREEIERLGKQFADEVQKEFHRLLGVHRADLRGAVTARGGKGGRSKGKPPAPGATDTTVNEASDYLSDLLGGDE